VEELGKLKKKSNNLIGNGSRDLMVCSIVSQSTTLPSAPVENRVLRRVLGPKRDEVIGKGNA
jgi:hypothetical protein